MCEVNSGSLSLLKNSSEMRLVLKLPESINAKLNKFFLNTLTLAKDAPDLSIVIALRSNISGSGSATMLWWWLGWLPLKNPHPEQQLHLLLSPIHLVQLLTG